MQEFTKKVVAVIKNIPEGKVLTYGSVAARAGNRKSARQVSRILHSMSEGQNLPWHRVINSKGGISLRPCKGYEVQKALLESEGVKFAKNGHINLNKYLWKKQA